MIASIHQPNFLPWLGFFAKLMASDVMILMDNTQFPKGSWTNRVRIGGASPPQWLTVPIRKHALSSPISEIEISYDHDWRTSHRRTLEARYRRAAGYAETMALIDPVYSRRQERLAELTSALIVTICDGLGITTVLRAGSELSVSGAASTLLVNMCRAVGATTYLAGTGAAGYDDLAVYESAGIGYQRSPFRHPAYPQHGSPSSFTPGLSIVDAIASVGLKETRRLLRDSIGVDPKASMSIRPLTLELARKREKDLLTLIGEFPEVSWSAGNLFVELARKWELSVVLLDGDGIAAVSINSAKEDALYIHLILVTGEHRGRGLGTQLMTHLTELARRSGLRAVRLRTSTHWPRVVAFYERLGFSRISLEPDGNILFDLHVDSPMGVS